MAPPWSACETRERQSLCGRCGVARRTEGNLPGCEERGHKDVGFVSLHRRQPLAALPMCPLFHRTCLREIHLSVHLLHPCNVALAHWSAAAVSSVRCSALPVPRTASPRLAESGHAARLSPRQYLPACTTGVAFATGSVRAQRQYAAPLEAGFAPARGPETAPNSGDRTRAQGGAERLAGGLIRCGLSGDRNHLSYANHQAGYRGAMSATSLDDPVIQRFRRAASEVYGGRIERVVLFGSRAGESARRL